MEGGPIAVSSAVTLPAQPTTGTVSWIPLGGDGYVSPMAAYAVVGHSVTGAVGGGSATLQVVMDSRFTSLVSWVTWANTQVASADADFRVTIGGPGVPTQAESGLITAIAADVSTATISRTWNPNPSILPGGANPASIQMSMLNVDADVYSLSCLIYLFNIRAREITPMGPLLFARGAT